MTSSNRLTILLRTQMVGLILVLAASVLALAQPLLGFAAVLAWGTFVAAGFIVTGLASLAHRLDLSARRPLIAAWGVAYLLSGIIYALASYVLGLMVNQSVGFKVYGAPWLFNVLILVLYIGLTLAFERHERYRARLAG